MIKSTIALLTTFLTITLFLSPALADSVPLEETETQSISSLIVPVHDVKAKKTKQAKKQRSEAQRIRDEKYIGFECVPEDNTCEQEHNNDTYNPPYNSSN